MGWEIALSAVNSSNFNEAENLIQYLQSTGLFSKNEKQMIDNVNEIKRDNEDFKDSQKYIFDTHKADVNNPHKVTKSQIGLGNVDNVKQAPAEEFNNHVNSKNNPHAVTKTQVGLGNVDNIRQASKAEFDIHIEDKTLHTTEAEKKQMERCSIVPYN